MTKTIKKGKSNSEAANTAASGISEDVAVEDSSLPTSITEKAIARLVESGHTRVNSTAWLFLLTESICEFSFVDEQGEILSFGNIAVPYDPTINQNDPDKKPFGTQYTISDDYVVLQSKKSIRIVMLPLIKGDKPTIGPIISIPITAPLSGLVTINDEGTMLSVPTRNIVLSYDLVKNKIIYPQEENPQPTPSVVKDSLLRRFALEAALHQGVAV
jgi:hypothetical protein